MKIEINISENFATPIELMEFAAKLHTVFALPLQHIQNVAAAGVASAVNNAPAQPPMQAVVVPRDASAGRAAGASDFSPVSEPETSVVVGPPAASPQADLLASLPSAPPAATTSPATTDAPVLTPAPKKAGRPRKAKDEDAAPQSAELPKAQGEGAAGTTAGEPKTVAEAVAAGAAQASDSALFMDRCRIWLAENPGRHGAYLEILGSYGTKETPCKSARMVPEDKRAECMERLNAAAAEAQAA
jgi:hypothetical protein